MSTFTGTASGDYIYSGYTSAGVTADPVGTTPGMGSDTIYGNGGSDYIDGSGGNDVIYTGAGNDTAYGGAGDDYFDDYSPSSYGGNDLFDGGVGNDTIYGYAGYDSLYGGDGTDYLYGEADNDTLDGGSGADSMYGGSGSDTYYVDVIGDYVEDTVDNNSNFDRVYSSVSFTLGGNLEGLYLSGRDNLYGTGNDIGNEIEGNNSANILTGLGGADSLSGLDGADSLIGGTGNDYLYGGIDDDTLSGGDDNDYLEGGDGNDLEYGGSGNDTLYGSNGSDALNGEAGDDYLSAGEGSDTLAGGIGNDRYYLGSDDASSDTIVEYFNEGIDTVELRYNTYSYILGDGLENVEYNSYGGNFSITGNDAANNISGSSGGWYYDSSTFYLSGLGGNDSLIGGDGYDTLVGGTGADYMSGRYGDDSYYVDSSSDTVYEAYSWYGDDIVYASVNHTLAANVERLTLTGAAATGTGNDLNNVLVGDAMANTLSGLAGDDTLDGGGGTDTLNGGDGIDTALYTVNTTSVSANLATGVVSFPGQSWAAETLTSIENVTTGSGADNLVGSSVANVLNGGAGNDTLDGAGGTDVIIGGDGVDTVLYTVNTTSVNVNLGTGVVSFPGQTWPSESLTSIESVATGSGADTILGSTVANALNGGAGNDSINGLEGNDTMTGGTGNDIYYVDSTLDQVIETTAGTTGGTDIVYSRASFTLGANVESLRFVPGSGAINGTGNSDANELWGTSSVNTLRGLAGADTFDSGDGADILIGGTGADVFKYSSVAGSNPAARDIIRAGDGAVAFEAAGAGTGDRFDFRSFDANTGASGVQHFAFGTTTGVAHLWAVNSGTNTLIRGNVDADATVEFELTIEDGAVTASAYTAADFLLA